MIFHTLFTKKNLVNLILLFIPISFILGNLAINIVTITLIAFVLLSYKTEKIFFVKFTEIDKIIILFFFYIIVIGTYSFFLNSTNQDVAKYVLTKSFFFTRFLILYFVLKFVINKKIINFNIIFIFYSLVVIFVSADVIIQFIFGYDIFGFEASGRRYSGPFGDEYISGSFIQRFFIFPLFTILFYLKFRKSWSTHFFLFIAINLSAVGILLSGNRVPFIMFVIMLTIFFIFEPKVRKSLLYTIILVSIAFFTFFNSNNNFKTHYSNLLVESSKISNYFKLKISGESLMDLKSSYIKEIESGILTWKENRVFGSGVKSFYNTCINIGPDKWTLYGGVNCNQHPHNYYLEIVSALGIVGLVIVIIFFFKIILVALKKIFTKNKNRLNKNLIFPFLVLLLVEIFPIKTTGSFFTTGNATFLFIIIAILVGLSESKSKLKF